MKRTLFLASLIMLITVSFAQEKQFTAIVSDGNGLVDSIWMNPDTTNFTTSYLLHNGNPIVSTKTVNMYNLLLSYHVDSAAKYGNADDYMFKDAFSKGTYIYIPKWDERDYYLAGRVEIPLGTRLVFANGAMIDAPNDTLKGNYTFIEAGIQQIFTENSLLSQERLDWAVSTIAYPEWFGAIPDSLNDCRAAIQKCLDVFHQNVHLTGFNYLVEGTLELNSRNTLKLDNFTMVTPSASTNTDLFRITKEPFVIEGGIIRVPAGYNSWIFSVEIDRSGSQDRTPRTMSLIKNMIVQGQGNIGIPDFRGNAYNGLKVRAVKEHDFSYFSGVESVDFYRADTAIYMVGNPVQGMSNSWHFSNVTLDWPMTGVVLEETAAGHVFSNLVFQSNTQYHTVMLDVASSYNSFHGMAWDVHSDSLIILRPTADNNWFSNFGWTQLYEKFTRDETNYKPKNTFSTGNPFEPTSNGNYNYYTTQKLGVGIDNNKLGSLAPQLFVASKDYPVLNMKRRTTLTGGSLDGTSGIASGIVSMTQTSGNMANGFGGGFIFLLKDNTTDSTAYTQNMMGRLYARRDGADDKGMIQLFTKGSNATQPTMTLRNSGFVGIGTSNPQADLHVAGNLIVDGTITNAPNKAVDANTVTINEVLNLKPRATPPPSPKTGDLYVGTDQHIYCYLGGIWKRLD